MICVSIGRGRHRHMIAEHRHLAEQGVKLVELRLDYIRTKVNLGRLLDNRPCPVVITVRRERDGGVFNGDENQRRVLLRSAIVHGAEYVDLEEDIAGSIPRYGKTKRIISYHDFRRTPENLEELHARMCTLDPDIIKLACIANHPLDNLRMLRLVRQSKVPTVGLCMGDIGTPSRILMAKFGAPFSYATFHPERRLAPGQLSYEEMRDQFRYEQIGPDTEVYGVIGDPIGHSLSPLLHNAAFQRLNLNKVYIPFRVGKEDLAGFIQHAAELDIRGLSVTIPHKEAVLPLMDEVDEAARQIGAVNTVMFENGKRRGYNTDCQAAIDSLRAAIREPTGLMNKTAVVLGSGGAAMALIYGLKCADAQVVVAARDIARARALAQRYQCGFSSWEDRHEIDVDVLVNCTPVGMHPKVDDIPYDAGQLRPGCYVFDTVYNPENTLLIKEAQTRNAIPVTGVEMFVRQAALQFRMFTGQEPPAGLFRDVLKRATSAVRV